VKREAARRHPEDRVANMADKKAFAIDLEQQALAFAKEL
jgi:hypothetical protein